MKMMFNTAIMLCGMLLCQNAAYADKNKYIECPPVEKIITTEDGANALYTARYADKFIGYASKLKLTNLDAIKLIKVEPRNYRVICSYNAENNQNVSLVLEKKFNECMLKDKNSAVCSD